MDQGWIKLYRKINQNDFLMTDNNAYILFTKLLTWVDRKTGTYRTGQRALAEAVNLPYGTTYHVLQRLQAEGLLFVESNKKFSKIHIANWTVYQSNKELDEQLEYNATVVLKQSNGGKVQKSQKSEAPTEAPINRGKYRSSEALSEAQVKHMRSTAEDYNKKEEVRNRSINTIAANKSPEHERISKLYYDAVKALGLPILNHNTLRSKIKQMTTEVEYATLEAYLLFVAEHYPTLLLDYKPQLNNALDIYSKRVQITNAMQQHLKGQAKEQSRTLHL